MLGRSPRQASISNSSIALLNIIEPWREGKSCRSFVLRTLFLILSVFRRWQKNGAGFQSRPRFSSLLRRHSHPKRRHAFSIFFNLSGACEIPMSLFWNLGSQFLLTCPACPMTSKLVDHSWSFYLEAHSSSFQPPQLVSSLNCLKLQGSDWKCKNEIPIEKPVFFVQHWDFEKNLKVKNPNLQLNRKYCESFHSDWLCCHCYGIEDNYWCNL